MARAGLPAEGRPNNRQGMFKRVLLTAGVLGVLAGSARAGDTGTPAAGARPNGSAFIGIIIDDVGEDLKEGRRAIDLPGPVAYSFLPYRDYVRPLARMAHRRHKEIMLHLPMEAVDERPLGRGGLTLDMTHGEVVRTIRGDLAAVPYVEGINNHMGSLLTRHPGMMMWLMREINRQGNLFFIDSRTTVMTVAQQVADENGVPNLRRDVFLDDDLSSDAIAYQFRRLVALARRQGWALAIGHPHPATLAFLQKRLSRLAGDGVKLVPVSYLVRHYSDWQVHPGGGSQMVRAEQR